VRRADWHAVLRPSLAGLDAAQRERLAQAWLSDALEEHASVATFARLALQLVSLGAPPELLRATQRATLDEIAHAELCFGLASAYAGRNLGPGRLDADDALDGVLGSEDIALAAVREGCVEETIGAMVATAAATRAEDSVVRGVLKRIAADETRHAGLAWRCVRWVVARDRGLEQPVMEAFDAELRRHPEPVGSPEHEEEREDARWLARHGRLSDRERALVACRTMREVVMPCRRALASETQRRPSAQEAERV
jgi:hypothetical protein